MMNSIRVRIAALAVSLFAALAGGCGGDAAPSQERPAASLATASAMQAPASAYNTTVQQLYVAYFGRPADPGGLANFSAALASLNAPTDLPSLDAAYGGNAEIRTLVDRFGTSDESKALYTGDPEAFVSAIYRNLFGRDPAATGLAFWSGAVRSGALSQSKAAVAIMAGALMNKSAQGLLDAQTVANKVMESTMFTSALAMPAQVDAYKGKAAAATARSMLAGVSNATSTAALQSNASSTIAALVAAAADAARPRKLLAAGNSYSAAVKADGSVWTWGDNSDGQLCLGDTNMRTTPTRVSAISDVVEVSAGFGPLAENLYLLKKDGTVWTCGINSGATPVQVTDLHDIVSVAGSNIQHMYALARDGTLWAWDGYLQPKAVLSGVAAFSGGDDYVLALKQDATVWVTGNNYFGQLGTGDYGTRDVFEHVGAFDGAKAVATGKNQSFVTRQDGTVIGSGYMFVTEPLGPITWTIRVRTAVPTTVASLDNVASIAIGESHVLVLKKDGALWSWGGNRNGATGLGAMDDDTATPAQVPGLANVVAIAAGRNHSIALKSDGTLWVSGNNDSAQLGIGRASNVFVQVPNWTR